MKNRLLWLFIFVLLIFSGCSPNMEIGEPSGEPAAVTPNQTAAHPPTSTAASTQADETNAAETESPTPPETEEIIEETPTLDDIQDLSLCSGELTSQNQEGPFYSQGSPRRDSLIEPGMQGNPVTISGYVFDRECNPLPGIKLDFWLADVNGKYDNSGYTLRGYTLTDERGFYSIESIEPTSYTGRPPHIHVKLFDALGIEILTTQMYFPGSENSADVFDSPDLLVDYSGLDETGRQGVTFNFTVGN